MLFHSEAFGEYHIILAVLIDPGDAHHYAVLTLGQLDRSYMDILPSKGVAVVSAGHLCAVDIQCER